jgi:hypothetical protein
MLNGIKGHFCTLACSPFWVEGLISPNEQAGWFRSIPARRKARHFVLDLMLDSHMRSQGGNGQTVMVVCRRGTPRHPRANDGAVGATRLRVPERAVEGPPIKRHATCHAVTASTVLLMTGVQAIASPIWPVWIRQRVVYRCMRQERS